MRATLWVLLAVLVYATAEAGVDLFIAATTGQLGQGWTVALLLGLLAAALWCASSPLRRSPPT